MVFDLRTTRKQFEFFKDQKTTDLYQNCTTTYKMKISYINMHSYLWEWVKLFPKNYFDNNTAPSSIDI